jgi:hypothetical protein
VCAVDTDFQSQQHHPSGKAKNKDISEKIKIKPLALNSLRKQLSSSLSLMDKIA